MPEHLEGVEARGTCDWVVHHEVLVCPQARGVVELVGRRSALLLHRQVIVLRVGSVRQGPSGKVWQVSYHLSKRWDRLDLLRRQELPVDALRARQRRVGFDNLVAEVRLKDPFR